MQQAHRPGGMESPGQAGRFFMGVEGLSWPRVGFPAQGIFPSAGQHAGLGATRNFSGSGSGVGLFLKLSLVLPSSSLIAKCFLV